MEVQKNVAICIRMHVADGTVTVLTLADSRSILAFHSDGN
jgi:hypothetical protein